jgi:site-specific DNA recombinase
VGNDSIDLPPHELRDLIRGTIWRDEHFNGMTIRDIASRDAHSEVFVGRLIHRTFEVT